MEQFELLWRYMEEDGKADAIAKEIRESDKRRQLEKHRDTILTQQKLYQEITARCGEMIDREAVISEDALPRYEAKMDAIQKVLELKDQVKTSLQRLNQVEMDIEDLESKQDALEDTESPDYLSLMEKLDVLYQEEKELTKERDEMVRQVERQLADLAEIEKSLKGFEKELRQILQVNTEDRKKEANIRRKVATAKMEFDRLKPEFAAEKEALAVKLEAQRAVAEACSKGIDAALLARYQKIKHNNVTPPLARMKANRCSGCNTMLPSAVLKTIQSKEAIECETCHRLIIPV